MPNHRKAATEQRLESGTHDERSSSSWTHARINRGATGRRADVPGDRRTSRGLCRDFPELAVGVYQRSGQSIENASRFGLVDKRLAGPKGLVAGRDHLRIRDFGRLPDRRSHLVVRLLLRVVDDLRSGSGGQVDGR